MERLAGDTAARRAIEGVVALVVAVAASLAFFLLLPVIQAIGTEPRADLGLRNADTTSLPPPPPPEPEEPEEEPEEEPPPPEMLEEAPPLDLAQLDLALADGVGGEGWAAGDFALQLDFTRAKDADAGNVLGLDDLDQKPRVTYQASPLVTDAIRRKAPGTVVVLFVVGPDGRVEEPKIQSSTDPVFEAPAVAALKKWRFEPGTKNGAAVRFRMRVPITFPAP